MSLLDGFKAAVLGTAATRSGFLKGEKDEQDSNKRENLQAAMLVHQSRLDQIRAAHDAAQADSDTARAALYRKRLTDPPPGANAAPHTLPTDQGIMQWDPATKTFKPTGMHPPEKATQRNQDRMDKRERRIGTQQALQGVTGQIRDTERDIKDAPTDFSLPDDAAVTSRVSQLKARKDSLTHVSDSLNAEIKAPGSGATKPTTPSMANRKPAVNMNAANPADAEYQAAANAYKAAMSEATTDAERAEAQALYNKAVANVAKRRKQVP